MLWDTVHSVSDRRRPMTNLRRGAFYVDRQIRTVSDWKIELLFESKDLAQQLLLLQAYRESPRFAKE